MEASRVASPEQAVVVARNVDVNGNATWNRRQCESGPKWRNREAPRAVQSFHTSHFGTDPHVQIGRVMRGQRGTYRLTLASHGVRRALRRCRRSRAPCRRLTGGANLVTNQEPFLSLPN